MQCLLLLLNPRSRGKHLTIQFLWRSAGLLVRRARLIYLVDELFFVVPGAAERNKEAGWIQGFIFLFLVLIRWNEKESR